MEKFNRSKFIPPKALAMYKIYLRIEFSEIKDFINETKYLIQAKEKEIEKHIDNEIKKVSHPNSEQEIIDHFIEDFIKYDRTYIELLMNSTFISSFSLFESSFNRICKYAKSEKGTQLILKDLSGNGIIDKCKKYIEKVIEIDLSSLNTSWNEIKNYNKIRNLIVHNSANLKKDKNKALEEQEMYSFIVSNNLVQLKNERRGNFYIKDHQFIIDFCEKAETYLSEIITKVLKIKKTDAESRRLTVK